MKVYKKLSEGCYNKQVADKLGISETHVGRIAKFLTDEFFLKEQYPKSIIQQFEKTKRIPSSKIIYQIMKNKKNKDGGSFCENQRLQYKCIVDGKINDKIKKSWREFSPKGCNKYIYPPHNEKIGFKCIFHDGIKKSVIIYPGRIYLTNDELEMSEEIIKERVIWLAKKIQHLFKVKLGFPEPVDKVNEYAFVPKESFLIDALEKATFKINSPVGMIKADSSGIKEYSKGKQIEFDNIDLAKTYLDIIPCVNMFGKLAIDNKGEIEQLNYDVKDIKTVLNEIKPHLQKIIRFLDEDKKLYENKKKDSYERGYV